MKHMHLATTGLLVTGMLFLAGCGSSSTGNTVQTSTSAAPASQTGAPAPAQTSAAAASTSGSPCDLVTAAEAEKAVGAPLGTPTVTILPQDSSSGLGLNLCQYPRTTGGFVYVGVITYTGAITSDTFNQYRQTKVGTTDVSGVGDQAFEIKDVSSSAITFRKGSKAVEVTLVSDANREAKVLELARAAAARL